MIQIKSILDWFKQVEPSYLDKLYEKLMRARNQLMLERLKKIKEKGNYNVLGKGSTLTPNAANQSNNRRYSTLNTSNSNASLMSLVNEEKKSTMRSRLTENLLSSAGELRMGRKKSTVLTVNELALNQQLM